MLKYHNQVQSQNERARDQKLKYEDAQSENEKQLDEDHD